MKARICVVRWRDAHGIKTEANHADAIKDHRAAIYWSVGVLVQSDAAGITLAQDLGIPLDESEETTYRSRTFVPRELVEEEILLGNVIRKQRVKKVAAL